MKKFLSMVMAAAMVVSLVPGAAFAASGDVKATAKVVGSKNYTQDEIESSKVNKKVSGPEAQLTFTTADYASNSDTAVKYTLSLLQNFNKTGWLKLQSLLIPRRFLQRQQIKNRIRKIYRQR